MRYCMIIQYFYLRLWFDAKLVRSWVYQLSCHCRTKVTTKNNYTGVWECPVHWSLRACQKRSFRLAQLTLSSKFIPSLGSQSFAENLKAKCQGSLNQAFLSQGLNPCSWCMHMQSSDIKLCLPCLQFLHNIVLLFQKNITNSKTEQTSKVLHTDCQCETINACWHDRDYDAQW